MKEHNQISSAAASVVLSLSFLLLAVGATAQQSWDPTANTNVTGAYSGLWDTSTKNWTPLGTQTTVAASSLVVYTPGNGILFAAGPSASTNQGTFTVTNNTANLVIGNIVNGDDNPGPCVVTITGTGSLTLGTANSPIIIDTYNSSIGSTTINIPINGTNSLECDDSGSTIFNAANTYSGGFKIDGSGGVSFGNNAAFGTGTITWLAAGFIQPVGSSAYNITNAMTHLATTETFSGNSGGVTFSGPWTLPSSGTVTLENIADTITVAGPVSGAAGVWTKVTGSAGWTFTGTNTYTGATTITNGTFTIGGSGSLGSGSYSGKITNDGILVYNSSATQTLGGVISGSGTLTLKSGKLILSGANTYTGNTTNSGGTLNLDVVDTPGTSGPLGAFATNAAGSIVMSGGTLQYSSANAHDYSGRFSTAANQQYKIDVNGQSVTFATAMSSSGGSLTLSDSAGGGTLVIGADNNYTGATTLSSGTVSIGTFINPFGSTNSPGNLNLAGGNINCNLNRATAGENILNPVIISGNSTLQAATTTGQRYLTFGGPLSSTGGSLVIVDTEATNGGAQFIVVFTNIATVGVPMIISNTTAGNTAQLAIWNSGTIGDQVYNGPISGPGSVWRATGFTTGSGARVIFNGTNTYSGGTSNTDGEIACGTSSSGPADLPTNGPIGTGAMNVGGANAKISAYGGAQTIGNHVVLASSPFTFTGTNALTMSGNFDFQSAVRTLVIGNTNTTTLSGSILNGGLIVSGGNTLTLSGSNAYTGVTTISNNSTLALAGTGSISNSSALNILAGSTFDVSAISAFALSSSTQLSASGTASAATINGASGGTVNLGSQAITLNYDGSHPALTVSQGTLALHGNAFTVNGTALPAGTYTIISQSSGSVSATGPFTVTGTALGSDTTATISVSGGSVNLIITPTPVFSGLTASPSITYGATSITLSGTLSASGPVYPANGETVSATINGATVNGNVSGSSGAFSITFNNPSLATDGVGGSPFTITYSYAGDGMLNSASNASTSLTVNPAGLSVTAGAQSKTYGQTVIFGSGSTNFSSFGLQNGETIGSVTLSVSGSGGTSNAPVSGSPYTITPSAATGGTFNANNYSISYVTNLLTVGPATLTVTADNYSIPFGATNPVFGVTYSNFVNGQTLGTSDVAGSPALSTGATTNSDVGAYVITNSIGTLTSTNYTFSLVNGTLTITNAVSSNAVAASPNPALPGATVTLTSTLSTLSPSMAVPTNSIQFQIDGSPYGSPIYPTNGVAATTNASLSHGYHTIEADYGGDTNALGATNILGSTNTANVLINTPPVAGTAYYQRPPNVVLTIAVSDLLTNATDADGDTLSLVSVSSPSTNGATVMITNNVVVYTPPATNGNVTDAFLYTVSDPYGATNEGTVVVTVVSDNGPSVNITGMTTLGDGTALISFAGIPNYTYLIQATTNLTPTIMWTTIGTNTAGTNGLFQFNDLDSTNYPTRYYRTATP